MNKLQLLGVWDDAEGTEQEVKCGSQSVPSDSLQPNAVYPARLLCPWNSPGKNSGVYPFSRPRNWTQVSCTADRFFTSQVKKMGTLGRKHSENE